MASNDVHELGQVVHATEPDKLDDLSLQELRSHQKALSRLNHPNVLKNWFGISIPERIQLVTWAIEERQHQEVQEIANKTLQGTGKTVFWARWAVLAAVVVPVVLALVSPFPFSKPRLAKTDRASPQTFHQTPAPNNASPGQEAHPSTSTPSPQQGVTTTPWLLSPTP